jgi:hypothetical protein
MKRKVARAMPKVPSRRKADKDDAQHSVVSIPLLGQQRAAALTPMNFKVPESFHREFKLYAVQHGMSMVELLQESFAVLRKQRGT